MAREDAKILYPPAQAAEALGVRPSTLRRWAKVYERVAGPLPRDERGGRLWPQEALAFMAEAKRRADAERISIEQAAARLAEEGVPERLDLPDRSDPAEQLLQALRGLDERLAAVEAELRALREENAALRRQLEAPEDLEEDLEDEEPRGLWAFLRRLMRPL